MNEMIGNNKDGKTMPIVLHILRALIVDHFLFWIIIFDITPNKIVENSIKIYSPADIYEFDKISTLYISYKNDGNTDNIPYSVKSDKTLVIIIDQTLFEDNISKRGQSKGDSPSMLLKLYEFSLK